MYIKKLEEKVPRKVGECIYLTVIKAKVPEPRPQLILAHFTHPTHFAMSTKSQKKISGTSLIEWPPGDAANHSSSPSDPTPSPQSGLNK